MLFLGLGIVLVTLKYLEYGQFAVWEWWMVLSPFAMAVVWWTWADRSGFTKKRIMARQEAKRQKRRERSREALGLPPDRGIGKH